MTNDQKSLYIFLEKFTGRIFSFKPNVYEINTGPFTNTSALLTVRWPWLLMSRQAHTGFKFHRSDVRVVTGYQSNLYSQPIQKC